jgi:hypothetical protein
MVDRGGILSFKGGIVLAKNMEVKCYVDSCEYWSKNNFCSADGIEVDNQAMSDMEIGGLGGNEAEAGSSRETYCRTYKPRTY